ncbi:MAG: hypothetical protein ISS72_08445 [Candidatus Brocadiae bacterium]|nr:hypothetical protein [Candidatus Brocadiia bacterium]
MARKTVVLVTVSVVSLAAAASLVAWHFWPEPPPSTAEQVYDTVMGSDPTQLSDEKVKGWIADVASTVERLPPHEFEKLIVKAMGDENLRKRFEALKPEQRRKLMDLVSEEQRSRMFAKMGTSMVKYFKAMPAALRNIALREMQARTQHRRGGGAHGGISKQRLMERHASTTPKNRAEFVRAMREMRKMLEQAGVSK